MKDVMKCCVTCKSSYDRVGSTVLWCRRKGDIAPTWYCCKQHEPKEDCEEDYDIPNTAA